MLFRHKRHVRHRISEAIRGQFTWRRRHAAFWLCYAEITFKNQFELADFLFLCFSSKKKADFLAYTSRMQ